MEAAKARVISIWNTRHESDQLRVARETLEFLHGGMIWRKRPDGNGNHSVPNHQMEAWNVAIRNAIAQLAKGGGKSEQAP
jgi:hypothetical protein